MQYARFLIPLFLLGNSLSLSGQTKFSQVKEASSHEISSPLMMLRSEEQTEHERTQNRFPQEVPREVSLGGRTEVVEGGSQGSIIPSQEVLERQMCDEIIHTQTMNAAIEVHQDMLEAQDRYDNSVSEAALLAGVPEQAAAMNTEMQQKLEVERRAHQQGVRRYAWSDRNFAEWSLPGELPEVVLPLGDPDSVVPPEMLHEEAEELGRKLLAEALEVSEEEAWNANATLKAAAMPESSSISLDEQIKNEIIEENLHPSEESPALIEQRLAARAKANELHKQAATLAKESRRLREAKAASNEKASASDERSSMFSSIGSSVFGGFSKANTVMGTTSHVRPVDLEIAAQRANEAERNWEVLAWNGEKIRSAKKGTFLEEKNILRIWKKADQELLAFHKKENAAQTLQESWEANTKRWQLCVKGEEAIQQLRRLEEELTTAQENRLIINERHLRGKATDIQQVETSQVVRAVQAKVDAARVAANDAEQAWMEEALHYERVKNAPQGERKQVLETLRCSDEAVTRVWFELTDRYSGNESPEEPTLEALQAKVTKEIEGYELKRRADLAHYFGATSSLGLVITDAKRTYRCGNKTAARALFDQANELAIAAYHDYMEAAKQDALESARERIPEFAHFWTQRFNAMQAEQQARITAAQFKKSAVDPWADETQQALQHVAAVAAAEESAFHLYQKEERRLTDIETLFIAIIAAKKAALRERPGKAAAAYFAGDSTAWSQLSAEERKNYNQDIREANKIYETPFEEAIRVAEEKMASIEKKIKKALLYPSSMTARALQVAEKQLVTIQAKEAIRKKEQYWSKLTKKEREIETQTELENIIKIKTKWEEELERLHPGVKNRSTNFSQMIVSEFKERDNIREYNTAVEEMRMHAEHASLLYQEAVEALSQNHSNLVGLLMRAVDQFLALADYGSIAAEEYSSRTSADSNLYTELQKGKRWESIIGKRGPLQMSALQLAKAAEYLKRSMNEMIQENFDDATLWEQISHQAVAHAEYSYSIAQLFIKEMGDISHSKEYITKNTLFLYDTMSSKELEHAIKTLTEATEAKKGGEIKLSKDKFLEARKALSKSKNELRWVKAHGKENMLRDFVDDLTLKIFMID